MAKKGVYAEQAQQYYVFQQMTLAEIADRLPVSERSLSDWKQDGNWDEKRAQHLETKRLFHEELYSLGLALVRQVKTDLDAGKTISPTRLNFLTRVTGSLTKAKEYEEAKTAAETETESGTKADLINFIEKDILKI